MLSRTRKGFTLLELIVVIVILGILAAIAIPTFAAVIKKSRYATLKESAQATANNAVALAAFDQAAVRTVTGTSDAEKAGFAAYTTATTTANGGELPAGVRVVAGNANHFLLADSTTSWAAATDYACVTLPTTVNGASKVSTSALNSTVSEAAVVTACNLL